MREEDERPRQELSPESQRTVVLYSVLAGLCKLIPVPFLDDIAQGIVARRMVWLLLAERGLRPSSSHLGHLTRDRQGCPLGCVYSLFWTPLKKLFRTVLFFFAFRDCVAASARWFHRGYLTARAAQQGLLTAEDLHPDRAQGVWPVALAIEEALLHTQTNPIDSHFRQVLQGSQRLLRRIARDLLRIVWQSRRSAPEDPQQQQQQQEAALAAVAPREEAALADQLARLADRLWAQTGYLRDLEDRFARALQQTRARFPLATPASAVEAVDIDEDASGAAAVLGLEGDLLSEQGAAGDEGIEGDLDLGEGAAGGDLGVALSGEEGGLAGVGQAVEDLDGGESPAEAPGQPLREGTDL